MKLKSIILILLLAICSTACSNKGVNMPRHRKGRNCLDCPKFSMAQPQIDERTASYTI